MIKTIGTLFVLPGDVDPSLTMVQLGMDSLMSSEIKQTLYRNYQMDYDIKKIQELTFENFNDLMKDKQESSVRKPRENLQTVPNICLVANESVVKLKPGNGGKTIFFLHPIEGDTLSMVSLANRLDATVYGLQCTKECTFQTIQEYALHFRKLVRQKQPKGPYIFCGYSYGSLLCLELAFILEAEGEIVRIISVDGSPEHFKYALINDLTHSTKLSDGTHYKMLEMFVSGLPCIDEKQVVQVMKYFCCS